MSMRSLCAVCAPKAELYVEPLEAMSRKLHDGLLATLAETVDDDETRSRAEQFD